VGRDKVINDEIRADFALHFNKAALTETHLCKLEKKKLLTRYVRQKTTRRPQKYADISVCLEESVF
jgi:hypothetical protein